MVGKGKGKAAAAPVASKPMSVVDARRAQLLVKPRKRSRREALPSVLHLATSTTASMAVAAAVFIVAVTVAPKELKAQLMTGSMLAAITISIIAQPELGHSVRKGVQRIVGVMIGGWLFCGLYLAHQGWWFLALCLGVFTFAASASSFWLTGKEAMYPPMLVAAFVVCVGFATPQAAVSATLVKTLGIGGGILVYTLFSTVLFPRSATQQAIDTMGLALSELRDLADSLLRGRKTGASATGALAPAAAAAASSAAADAAAVPTGRGAKGTGGLPLEGAATLAASVPAHLREVQQILPAASKERFLGRVPACPPLGSKLCFVPSALTHHQAWHGDILAAAHVASTVHRVLWLMLSPSEADGGAASIVHERLPKALGPEAAGLVTDMGDAAVAALQEFSAALPPVGGPAAASVGAGGHVERYAAMCERLYSLSLGLHKGGPQQDGGAPGGAGGGGGGGRGSSGGGGGAGFGAVGRSGLGGASASFKRMVSSTSRTTATATTAPKGMPSPVTAAAPPAADTPARQRWQRAVQRVTAANAAERRRGDDADLGAFVSGVLKSGDVATQRWCATLVLLQQLGVTLWRLQDCLAALLPRLPGAQYLPPSPSSSAAAASPLGVESV